MENQTAVLEDTYAMAVPCCQRCWALIHRATVAITLSNIAQKWLLLPKNGCEQYIGAIANVGNGKAGSARGIFPVIPR